MKLILKTFIFFMTSILFSQNEKINRDSYILKVPIDEEQFYQQNIKKSPYFVKENILQLFTGEKLFIEIESDNGIIKSMKVVDKKIHPEKTVEIELSQTTERRKHKRTTLKLKNPFEKDLEYQAIMGIYGVKNWIKTNVYPIGAKLASYESWPDPIITLILKDWKFKQKKKRKANNN